MGEWRFPPGMVGNPNLIRVGAIAGDDDEFGCASHIGTKVRPAVQPRVRATWPTELLQTFTLEPFMAELDRIEFPDSPHDGGQLVKPQHPGLERFTRHALDNYVVPTDGEAAMVPVRGYWVAQATRDRMWELYAWGRRYESVDGTLREFRFLRFGEAGSRDPDMTQIAIAVYSTAFGSLAPWPVPWSEPFQLSSPGQVERVRVVEVGLLGGAPIVRFAGSTVDAEGFFAEYGRDRLGGLVAGGPARPGGTCVTCKQVTGCMGLPRIPGLLGLPARRAPLRKVSVSDLRYHEKCPAQAHLRSLNLPKVNEYDAEAVLGHAVHGWLEDAHASRTRCDLALPADDRGWASGRWEVGGDLARVGVRMLSHHRETCALACVADISDVLLEPQLAFHDTAANAIVLAKPDMLYVDDGSWVWREIKTTQKSRWFHDDLLDEFPQLALGVLVLAEGALGGDPAGSRVELEVLRPDRAEIVPIDAADPGRIAKARGVIGRLAGPWREDTAFEARPGRNCRWCPVSRWCPSFEGTDPDVERR